jgi:PAS domain S-box-containing protein
MAAPKTTPSGHELVMRDDDFIVSKTDLTGKITYANRIFMEFARYEEQELLGAQHNIIRHPEMPRCVFKLLWDRIQAGQEIFAYVMNLSSDGSHYWVLANVTPTLDVTGQCIGYYSVRRKPRRDSIELITGLYGQLRDIERQHRPAEGMAKATDALLGILESKDVGYDEFIFSISGTEMAGQA